jgi:hypothetical protein
MDHSTSRPTGYSGRYDFGSHYQICFDTWGNGVRNGYDVSLEKDVGFPLGHKAIWKTTYYGPKRKTCSSWRKANGKVFVYITRKKGAVYGNFWIYWY